MYNLVDSWIRCLAHVFPLPGYEGNKITLFFLGNFFGCVLYLGRKCLGAVHC